MICVRYINKKSVGKKGTREYFLDAGTFYPHGKKYLHTCVKKWYVSKQTYLYLYKRLEWFVLGI